MGIERFAAATGLYIVYLEDEKKEKIFFAEKEKKKKN